MTSSTILWIPSCFVYPIFANEAWSLREIYELFLPPGKQYLFIGFPRQEDIEESITFGDVLLAITGYLVDLAGDMQLLLISCIHGIASATIYEATSKFVEIVQSGCFENQKKDGDNVFIKSQQITIVQLRGKFSELMKLVNAVNAAWFPLIFWFLLHTTIWYSTNLDRALKTNSYFSQWYLFYFMGYTAASVVLSAECARKVKSVFESKMGYVAGKSLRCLSLDPMVSWVSGGS